MFIEGDIYYDECDLGELDCKLRRIISNGKIKDGRDLGAIEDAIDLIAELINLKYQEVVMC